MANHTGLKSHKWDFSPHNPTFAACAHAAPNIPCKEQRLLPKVAKCTHLNAEIEMVHPVCSAKSEKMNIPAKYRQVLPNTIEPTPEEKAGWVTRGKKPLHR